MVLFASPGFPLKAFTVKMPCTLASLCSALLEALCLHTLSFLFSLLEHDISVHFCNFIFLPKMVEELEELK